MGLVESVVHTVIAAETVIILPIPRCIGFTESINEYGVYGETYTEQKQDLERGPRLREEDGYGLQFDG